MPAASLLKYARLAYFSQPQSERTLYRHIRRTRPLRIVEIGMGDGTRSSRLIAVAQRYAAARQVRYTCIDEFELREPAAALSLKAAFRLLKPSGAIVRLLPGDVLAALQSAANSLTGTDLVLIDHSVDAAALEAAWFYFPRMMHAGTHVLREWKPVSSEPSARWQKTDHAEIHHLAAVQQRLRRRRAA